jgi:hypothetical protein
VVGSMECGCGLLRWDIVDSVGMWLAQMVCSLLSCNMFGSVLM